MPNAITIYASSLAEFKKLFRVSKRLPVYLDSYITGGTWTDKKDGETVFVRGSRLRIAKVGSAAVSILCDGQVITVTPDTAESKYAICLTEKKV